MRLSRAMGIFAAVAALKAGLVLAAENPAADGWSVKFYNGLEAAGDVVFNPTGYQGKDLSIELRWTDGMPKFGVAKTFRSKLKGVVDWTVLARVKGTADGRVGAAMEFFDKRGRSLGVVDGAARTPGEWTPVSWKFTSPREAVRAEVHLLSLEKAPVAFTHVSARSAQGVDKDEVPLAMKVLPAEWNRDWNGGRTRMLNFSDAPVPMSVFLRGNRKALKAPAFEIDLPDGLEIKDSYCPQAVVYGHETPVSETATGGVRRIRFENLRYFERMKPAGFEIDGGGAISLVIGPKAGGEGTVKAFRIVCRTLDGSRVADERTVEMEFRPLPTGLRTAKDFIAMGWNSTDRRISDDGTLKAALRAYEAAGLRMFRLDLSGTNAFPRIAEIRAILEGRPRPYVFAARLGDMWHCPCCRITKAELEAMGGNLSVTSDKEGRRANKICPQFFTTDEAFHRHIEENAIRQILKAGGVKDGDWVTMDMEPWQSGTYCYCERCRKAFAEFAKLDHVPTMAEASGMRDAWAEFRVRHSAKSVEILEGIVHRCNPTLKLVDYDYILEYGNPESRAGFIRNCAKDTLMNETWLGGHLCSYYHCIGKRSFDAMRNNVRNLKKPYIPMAGLSGYASWVRKGEVLNPRQIRQFALAAFANGCPGYAFYSGNCFDGEVLLAMMEAQDEAAKWEGLPWGKTDGTATATSASEQFAFASTVKPDGSEVLALFNYDPEKRISADVAGTVHELEPFGVKFISVESKR